MAAQAGELSTIAERYAGALFDLARERGEVDAVERALDHVQAALTASSDFKRLVTSPVFTDAEKFAGVNAVLKTLQIQGVTHDFLLLLAKNRRLFAVEAIVKAYKAMAARERGEVEATVISAIPLTEAQRQTLSDELRQKLGRSPNLVASVDPSLLGGLVVKVGSQMFDTSLRTKLKHLEIAMKEAR